MGERISATAIGEQHESHARRDAHPNWKKGLPVLRGDGITLRELRVSDATSLLALLTTEEVTRFISPPPTTIEGFERFITWTQREREAGRYACFAVVPDGYDTAIGLFQIRQLDPSFEIGGMGLRPRIGVLGLGPVRQGCRARCGIYLRGHSARIGSKPARPYTTGGATLHFARLARFRRAS